MNLKKHFNIVLDLRLSGGKRTAISVNQLPKYLGETRANLYYKIIPKLPHGKKRYSLQGKGFLDVYTK